MEIGDLVAYEFVTPSGDWSWTLGQVYDHRCECTVQLTPWYDESSGALRGPEAKEYSDACAEAVECQQTAKRLGEEVAALRRKTMQQRAQAEENDRIAREKLEAAQQAVRTIDNSHLREMRSYRTPPTLVKETLAAVLHLLRQSPHPETWESVQRIVRRSDFISSVVSFNADDDDINLHRSVLENYLRNPAMTVENVNLASRAAGPLLQWLFAKIGATTAHVELRTMDAELHSATEKLKETTKRIELYQRKGAAAQERAEAVKARVEQTKLTYHTVPGSESEEGLKWMKDTSASAVTVTILASSILCNFGQEAGNHRVLKPEELTMITEAHSSASRDNNERVRVALEALSAAEHTAERLRAELRSCAGLRDAAMEELEEERTTRHRLLDRIQSQESEITRLRSIEQHYTTLQQEKRVIQDAFDAQLLSISSLEQRARELDVALRETDGSRVQLAAELQCSSERISSLMASKDLEAAQVDEERHVLHSKLRAEEKECATLRALLDKTQQENANFAERIGALASEVSKRDEIAARARHDLEMHSAQCAELSSRLASRESEVESLTQQMQKLEAVLASEGGHAKHLIESNNAMSARLQEAMNDLSSANRSVDDLKAHISHLQSAVAERDSMLQEAQASSALLKLRMEEANEAFDIEMQRLQASNNALEAALATATAAIGSKEQALAETEEMLHVAESETQTCKRGVDQLKRDLAAALTERDAAVATLSQESSAVVQSLHTKQESLQATTREQAAVIAELEAKLSNLSSEAAALIQARDEDATRVAEEKAAMRLAILHHEKAMVELQAQVEQLSDEAKHANLQRDATEQRYAQLQEAHKLLLVEHSDTRKQLDGLLTELEGVKVTSACTIDGLRRDLAVSQEQLDKDRMELQRWTAQDAAQADLRATLQSTVAYLQKELESSRRELIEGAHVTGTEVGRSRAELLQAQDTIRDLQREVGELRNSDQALRGTVERLKVEHAVLQRELEATLERQRITTEVQLSPNHDRSASSINNNNNNYISTDEAEAASDPHELAEMRDRLEREIQYAQSVHSAILAQHLQIEKDLTMQLEDAQRTRVSLQRQQGEAEDRLQRALRRAEAAEAETATLSIRLQSAEGQVETLLAAQQAAVIERDAAMRSRDDARAELLTLQQLNEELVALREQQRDELDAYQQAQQASCALEEEFKAELDDLEAQRDELLSVLQSQRRAVEEQAAEHKQRVAALQEQHREVCDALEREKEQLFQKLAESGRHRISVGSELVDTAAKLQQEKLEAMEELTRQLHEAWAADDESRRAARTVQNKLENTELRLAQLEQENTALRNVQDRDVASRQDRLQELARVHLEQLASLRAERDKVIQKLRTEEAAHTDAKFANVQLKARLETYEKEEVPNPNTAENSRHTEELLARLQELQRRTPAEPDQRANDSKSSGLAQQLVEHKPQLIDSHHRESQLEAEDSQQPQEKTNTKDHRDPQQRRLESLGSNGSERSGAQPLFNSGLSKQHSGAQPPVMTPSSQHATCTDSKQARTPSARLRPGSTTLVKPHRTSVAAGHEREDYPPPAESSTSPSPVLQEGAHLAVHLGALTDLQHNGKPLGPAEVYVKLKTIKEKHRTTSHEWLSAARICIDESYTFHLAEPSKDVVHVAVFAKRQGALFDKEIRVGDVDLSMAMLCRGVPHTRTVWVVQDARTKKARCAGFICVTLRSDDFGAVEVPSQRQVLTEQAKYHLLQQTFAADHPERLHAIDVYMSGEAAAIEETAVRL